MKFPLLVFAALGFLTQVVPARGGGTRCGRTLPGHCRLYCHQQERTTFMCDRYKQCCVLSVFPPGPRVSPYASKSKSSGMENDRKPAQEPATSSNPESTSTSSTTPATAPVSED